LREAVPSGANDQPFDNVELDYTYSSGGSITTTFENGFVRYRWLSGPFEGVEERDLKYQSRRIGDDFFDTAVIGGIRR
jgi:hypothetical protein